MQSPCQIARPWRWVLLGRPRSLKYPSVLSHLRGLRWPICSPPDDPEYLVKRQIARLTRKSGCTFPILGLIQASTTRTRSICCTSRVAGATELEVRPADEQSECIARARRFSISNGRHDEVRDASGIRSHAAYM